MKYWFELLTTDYDALDCFIPDGTVANAKRYVKQYMREHEISEAILTRNSLFTSNLLECIDVYV